MARDGQSILTVHLLTHLLQTDNHITGFFFFFITEIQQRTTPVPRENHTPGKREMP